MKLHDPSRPRIFHKPAFISGLHIVPRIQLWPVDDTRVELSLMLPVPDTRFSGSWKNMIVDLKAVPGLVQEYTSDPEKFIQDHFSLDVTNLQLPKPEKSASEPPSKPPPTDIHLLSLTDLV